MEAESYTLSHIEGRQVTPAVKSLLRHLLQQFTFTTHLLEVFV